MLPAPSGAPQSIDPSKDPLLGFVRGTDSSGQFQATVAKAIEQHPRVQEAIAAQREVRQVRAEVRAGTRPQLSVDFTGDYALGRDFSNDPDNIIERSRPNRRADARLIGEQLVTDFGATSNRIRAASSRIRAAEAAVRDVAGDTALEAVAAYYDVLAYQTLVDLGQAFIARHREILENTRLRFQQGYGPAGDVARVEAYVASAEGQVARFERQLAAARARYLEAFGSEAPTRVVRPAPPPTAAKSYEEAIELSRNAPAVARQQAEAEGAQRDYRAARADRFPRVSIAADATKYDVFDDVRDYDIRSRLILRHSLFSGGATTARANQALQRYRQAEFAAERTINEAGRDAGIAFRDLEVLTRQAETLERAYIANRRTRDLFVEQFKVARGSLIDILQAEQDYFESAVAYLQGSMELDVARYVLLDRTGEVLDHFDVAFSFNDASTLFGGQ